LNAITPGLHELVHSANHLKNFVLFLKFYRSIRDFLGGDGDVQYYFAAFTLIHLAVVHDCILIIDCKLASLPYDVDVRKELAIFRQDINRRVAESFACLHMFYRDNDVF